MPTLLHLGLLCALVLCAGQAAAQGASACPTFAIACEVRTTTLLNVRQMPGMTAPLAGPPQVKGAFGIITDGPVVVGGQPWWKIDYACCTDGWSSEAFLKAESLVPPPPVVEFTYKLPPCAAFVPPCVEVEVQIVPRPVPVP
jgi:hypothetical protein